VLSERERLGRYHAVLSAKFNDVRLDGELHNFTGIALVADVVNAGNEFTECPGFLCGFVFHIPKPKGEVARTSWGVYPIGSGRQCASGQGSGISAE